MIYYTADLHLGHSRVIEMDNRPFADVDEMDEALICLWNERITAADDVYIVGDFAYRNSRTAAWYLRRLKGRKHLVIGNHDRVTLRDQQAMECFASADKMMLIPDNKRSVSLCHFPLAEWNGMYRGSYHVFAHVHGIWNDAHQFMSRNDHALNAGCMLNGYRPVTLDELIENNLRFRQKMVERQEAARMTI